MPQTDLYTYATTVLGMSASDLAAQGIYPGSQSVDIPESTTSATIVSSGGLNTNPTSVRSVLLNAMKVYGIEGPEALAYAEQFLVDHPSVTEAAAQAQLALDIYDPASQIGKVVDRLYPEIQARRRASDQRVSQGLTPYDPVSVSYVQNYRTAAQQYARAEGLPPGLLDTTKLVANNVALPEVQSRLHNFYRAVQESAPDVVAQLRDYYGYTPAQIGALAVDPDQTEAHLVRQFESAQIGTAGARTGFGPVTAAEAEQLAAEGVTADQASQGFGQLAAQRGLFAALPGAGEDDITRQEQLAATFLNNQKAADALKKRRERRLAAFGGGGGLSLQGGVGGLGSAST